MEKHTVIKVSARPFPARTDADYRGRVATNLHTDQEPSPVTTFQTLDMVQVGLHRIVNLPDIRPPDIRWFFLPDTGYPVAGYPVSGKKNILTSLF